MTTIVKRLHIFALLAFALVFFLFGSHPPTLANRLLQATPNALPPTQPAIIGTLDGKPVEGIPGSFCWPQADGTPLCDFVDDPQPTTPVAIANGDALVFTVNPASPAPETLRGTLLDDKNADGEALETDLTATGGVFTIENLSDGPHRLQIDALYPGTEQSQPFVAYVYLLQIGPGAATPGATEGAAVAAETSVATETQGAEVTAEATQAVEATSDVAVTLEAATETAPETATEAAPVVTVEVSAPAATEAATLAAAEATTVVAPTLVAPTVVPPTVVPPTVVPPTAIPPTLIPPTAVIPPTATLAPPSTSTTPNAPTTGVNGDVTAVIPIPAVRLIVGGRFFDPIAVNACAVSAAGETLCLNRPANTAVARIFAAPGDAAQVDFGGPRPTAITLTFYTSDGIKVLSKQDVRPDNLILYNLPSTAGNYVISVEIAFAEGKATYYYRLAVS